MTTPVHSQFEAVLQAGLVIVVGSVAACASWSHVVELAERHGQPGWLAVADAAVLETMAVSMGLELRRRRRTGAPIVFVSGVLLGAVTLQLAAQVAQAPRTFWGWTMAALPAVGFLLLAKAAIARVPVMPTESMTTSTVDARPERTFASGEPDAHEGQHVKGESGSQDVPDRSQGRRTPTAENELLAAGRQVADALAMQSIPLTRAALIRELRSRGVAIGTARAGMLLAELKRFQAPSETQGRSATHAPKHALVEVSA